MKTYCWPLVLIGATLLMIGPALPWFRTYYGYVMLGEPTSRYTTGFHWGGFVSALGGVALLFNMLVESRESDGHGPFIISVLFGFLIAGVACIGLQPVLAEPQTYSPAFGLWVSVLGVALSIIGSRMRVSRAALKNKTSIAVLAALELLIIFGGWVLITRPGVGVQIGIWENPERLPSRLCLAGREVRTAQEAACVATVTAEAARPTATLAPLWQQWGH